MNEPTARRPSELRRLEESRIATMLGRLVPLAGAGAAALTVAAYLVVGSNPDSGASPSAITAYYSAHHSHVFVAAILLAYSSILFAVFGVAVWGRIRETGVHPVLAGAALVGTAVATASSLANASAWYVLGDIGTKHTISSGALQALHVSVSAADLPSGAGLGILLLAFASAGLVARVFPRWLTWFALVLGIVQLTPTPEPLSFFAGLAVLPWMFAAGISMLRGVAAGGPAPGRRRSAAPRSEPALTRN